MVGLLYLLVCLLLENGYAENGSSILLRLPDILQHLCPGAKVCRENQTLQAPMEVFEPGFESCCADCSCSFDCAETENCCFPSQQPQRNASGNQNDILQTTERSCLFLTIVPPPPEDHAFFQAYNMISSVSEPDSSANSTIQSNISCGDQRVAPWGSLYPVYSKRNNLLYKNAICATKNGAMDGSPFDAFLVCKETDSLFSDASNFVQLLDSTSNSVPRDCSVDFAYRGDINDLKSHKCYNELVNVCLASKSFPLTYDIGFSKEEVISACTSGLVSPYRKGKMYANIFCYICNGNYVFKKRSCRKIVFGRGLDSSAFTGLIDTNFITDEREDVLAKAKKIPKACEINDNDTCRPTYCPSGQLYDQTGRCTYPNKRWLNQDYTVYINLTTKNVIHIDELMPFKRLLTDISILKSPWPKPWSIKSVFYDTMYLDSNFTRFLVKIINKKSPVIPKVLIQTVKEMIRQEWVLNVMNATYILKSDFMAFSPIYVHDDDILFKNQSKSILYTRYRLVYQRLYRAGNKHMITNLYLCYQVELSLSEFILSRHKDILYGKISRQYLFNLQFTLIWRNAVTGARVCIEDSGLYQENQFALSNASSLCETSFVLMTVSAALVLDF